MKRKTARRPVSRPQTSESSTTVSQRIPETPIVANIAALTPAPPNFGGLKKPLTKGEVAAFFGVTVRTIESWVNAGRLPALRLSKRCVRFDPDTLKNTLALVANER
jgi:excisionase family DNA binding protein